MRKRKLKKCTAALLILITIIMSSPTAAFAAEKYNIGDAELPQKYEDGYIQHNCIDISEWNGTLDEGDWEDIKNAGVDSVIIRAGYSTFDNNEHREDSNFRENITKAKEAGMNIGVYYFSTALTEEEAVMEAEYVMGLIEEYKDDITLPVAYDFETNRRSRLNKDTLEEMGQEQATNLCFAFCDTLAEEEYVPMVYASRHVLDNYINAGEIEKYYYVWLAQYTNGLTATDYDGEYMIWQYSSKVYIDGVEKRVDANYLFEEDKSDIDKMSNDEAMDNVTSVEESAKKADEEKTESKEIAETDTKATAEQDKADTEKDSEKANSDTEKPKAETDETDKTTNDKEQTEDATEKDEPVLIEENVIFTTHNAQATVPVKSDTENAKIEIKDKTGFNHKYVSYMKTEYSNLETIFATLLSGYYTSGDKDITPKMVSEKIFPVMKSKATKKRVVSSADIKEMLKELRLDCRYEEKADDDIYVNIKSSLARGCPVILHINARNDKWGTDQFVLLLGMDENGKAIMADIKDREWSGDDQRIKIVSADELISYTCDGYIFDITAAWK